MLVVVMDFCSGPPMHFLSGVDTCGIHAERVDEQQSNERITDRILESIRKAEFVIVDLTHERPNVFYEAGYAHALGKTPVYLARVGTPIHFDIKDYPVIEYRNMKELKEGLYKEIAGPAAKKAEWRMVSTGEVTVSRYRIGK